MAESCNSRHFSWITKSCFPNPNDNKSFNAIHLPQPITNTSTTTTFTFISSLPDDLLLECLSRLPLSSLQSISLVCRQWSRLLLSPSFLHLRRHHNLLRSSLFAISCIDSSILAATLPIQFDGASWEVVPALRVTSLSFHQINQGFFSHARVTAIGPRIYVIGKSAMFRYDTWTRTVIGRSPMIFPRKKFATAVVNGKIYVAGGGGSKEGVSSAFSVEEYDPERDRWSVVAESTRKRYGCIGAAVDGVFYVIGGLKIGGNDLQRAGGSRSETHVYASSMDLYDVETGGWLRTRSVPGGGCVVAACAAVGYVYVLASHAVELSFWRFDARRKGSENIGNGNGFGTWCRIKSPPLPTQVRLDCTVRFSCVGVEDKVVLVQVVGGIDDLLRRSGRNQRGLKEGLVMIFDTKSEEWSRTADLPVVIRRAACACVEC